MKHVKISDKETPCESRSSRRPATAASGRSTHRRDSMGKYTGEAPLTIHEQATPSGFDYRPKTSLTTRRTPEYSITGKPYYSITSREGPSLGDHEVGGDLCWDEEKKTFYMCPKRKTWPYAPKEDAHLTCSTGAGHYKVVYRDVGSATKRSVSSRHRDKVITGPPNSCIQPVDTFGVETPGPDYTPNSPYWGRGPEHHFGVRLQQKSAETPGPGPGAYALESDLESVPAPMIGEKLYVDNDPGYPAPNEYSIPEMVGTGFKKSFGIKHIDDASSKNPPPNNYIIREPKGTSGPSMTYRAFHWPSETTAGPSDHDPSVSYTRPHTAEWSCRKKCKPVFPDILNYPGEYGPVQPAPGQHGCDREFHENSNPAHSIGALLPVKPNDNPGPNRYHIKYSNRSDIPTVPSYSMAQVLPKGRSKEETPAPCDYQANVGYLKPSTPSYSMTPRRKDSKGTAGPGPNAFNISKGQNHKGKFTGASFSLSSRHSPYKYSGFPSAALAKL